MVEPRKVAGPPATLNVVRGVPFPMEPPKLTLCVDLTARLTLGPVIAPPKVMVPPLIVELVVRARGSLMARPPVVKIEPLRVVVPGASVMSERSAPADPISPENVVAPMRPQSAIRPVLRSCR